MAISAGKLRNDPNFTGGARVLVAFSYAADQTVASAYAAAGGVEGVTYCRGLFITTAGTLACIPRGQTDAVSVPLAVGWHPLELVQINNSGSSTVAGFYYW